MRVALVALTIAGCGRLDFDVASDPFAIPDLIVRYPMDDDPASGVAHATSPAYDAACSACPTAVPGRLDGGYHFDGTQSIAVPARSASLVGLAPYTVAVWIGGVQVADSNGQRRAFVVKPFETGGEPDVFELELLDGTVEFETTSAAMTYDFLQVSVDASGSWHHVAAVWDGAIKTLYFNGARIGQESVVQPYDSALALNIGADIDTGVASNFWIGDIDDLRFYSRALDEAEIKRLATP
jgi:hypothetical protein